MPELTQEREILPEPQAAPKKVSRRQMLMTFGIALNAIASVLFAVPVVGYIFGPSKRKEIKKQSVLVHSRSSPKAKPGWPRTVILSFGLGTATLAIFLAGCDGFRPTSYRSLPSTAHTWAVQCVGFLNLDCSCALAMAGLTMPTAPAPQVHRHAASSNTTTKLKGANSGSKPGKSQPWPRRPARPAPINQRGAHASDQRFGRVV